MKKLIYILMFMGLSAVLNSQEVVINDSSTESISSIATDDAVRIATKFPDYPATPGDIYDIFFLTGANENQTLRCYVDIDYNIDLSFLGKVNVKGLIYSELQQLLKDSVIAAYPGSIVNVAIQSIGMFRVTLLGEVKEARVIDARSLMRLSDIIAGKTTDYASFRDIEIRSEDGSLEVYDLFQFRRYAKLKDNPYLKPNDVITVRAYDRAVTVIGEVRRAGKYQLKEEDTLHDLIYVYGDGYSKIAETSKIELQRRVDGTDIYSEDTIYIDGTKDDLKSFKLADFDIISIPSKVKFSSKVYIQGAISDPIVATGDNEDINTVGMSVSNKEAITIIEGNKVSTVLRKMKTTFNLSSNLEESFIVREGKQIPVNILDIQNNRDSEFDIVMMDSDILVVPFKQLVVYVGGSTGSGDDGSSAIPFIENRTAMYYIAQAGGFNKSENIFNSYKVYNSNGKKIDKDSIISPEDVIWVKRNHPMSYITEYAGWLTTILTVGVLSYEFYDYTN